MIKIYRLDVILWPTAHETVFLGVKGTSIFLLLIYRFVVTLDLFIILTFKSLETHTAADNIFGVVVVDDDDDDEDHGVIIIHYTPTILCSNSNYRVIVYLAQKT